MSSTLTVPVVKLENVRPHSNADKLELADVLGYQMAIPKGKYNSGDVVVYFPSDVLIPDAWSEKFGVKNFLRGPNKDRVGKIRLRGEPSFGLVADVPEGVSWDVGDNVADYFGCKKYEPPVKTTCGDAAAYDETIDPFIERYTDIENGRIYTEVFFEGEEVIVTEKLHGSNAKVGFVKVGEDFVPVAGSMSVRRKRPCDEVGINFNHPDMVRNTYWFPWSIHGVFDLLNNLTNYHSLVLLYGEVFGGSIQSLDYGIPKGKGLGFRAFDLIVDGKYLDWCEFEAICDKFGVPTAPLLYRGPYSMNKMKELSEGNTTLNGANHIREGVVVKPVKERVDPKIGRVVLKYISTEYDLSKYQEKDTTDV